MATVAKLSPAARGSDRKQIEGPQGELVAAVRSLFEANVFSASGHGNASLRLPHDPQKMLLTEPGVLRGMREDEVSLLDLDGTIISGNLAPTTTDVINMHAICYRCRPDINCVMHIHSPYATAFAVAAKPLPLTYEPFAGAGQFETVPVAPYGKRGEPASVKAIADTFAAHPKTQAMILANHGVLAFGVDPKHMVRVMIAFEEAARVAILAQPIGGAVGFL